MQWIEMVGCMAALRTFPAFGLAAAKTAYLAGNYAFDFSLLTHKIILRIKTSAEKY